MENLKMNYKIDVTEKEFNNKKRKTNKISDKKLQDAAAFAIVEADNWNRASNILFTNNNRLRSQTCVSALFAIELYLKSILLNMKINVTNEKFGHDIYSMYRKLDDELKNKIKKDIKIDCEVHKPLFDEVVRFNTFEEELEYISNDFMYLRYEYEKFLNGMTIITLTDFIMFLKDNCQKIAYKFNCEKNIKVD